TFYPETYTDVGCVSRRDPGASADVRFGKLAEACYWSALLHGLGPLPVVLRRMRSLTIRPCPANFGRSALPLLRSLVVAADVDKASPPAAITLPARTLNT